MFLTLLLSPSLSISLPPPLLSPSLSPGNTIHHTGGSGVDIEGGDKDSLTPAHHTVTGNTIHHWERVCLTYNPGVKVDGVGNTVSNNLLYVKLIFIYSFIHLLNMFMRRRVAV